VAASKTRLQEVILDASCAEDDRHLLYLEIKPALLLSVRGEFAPVTSAQAGLTGSPGIAIAQA
jgi:hypothetical protein